MRFLDGFLSLYLDSLLKKMPCVLRALCSLKALCHLEGALILYFKQIASQLVLMLLGEGGHHFTRLLSSLALFTSKQTDYFDESYHGDYYYIKEYDLVPSKKAHSCDTWV